MTVSDTRLPSTAIPRPLANGQMVLVLLVSFGAFVSFYLLLAVVPLYAAAGGAGASGAGFVTGATMLATVLAELAELAVARLVAGFGYRAATAVGLVLLAVSAAGPALSDRMPLILVMCLLRGTGLAIVAVVGPALTAELVPAERRGEGLGLYGVAVGVPAVIGLPGGVWLSSRVGFDPVFLISAGIAVVSLLGVVGLAAGGGRGEHSAGMLAGLCGSGLIRPALVFGAFTVVAGVAQTFLSLAMPASLRAWVPPALLAQAALTPFARWWAGRVGDRRGSGPLLVPAVAAGAAGTALLVWVTSPFAVIAGMALFGIGFGIGQNATLALMLERVPATEFGKASALWNFAYDGGFGIGAVGFGLLIGPVGYPAGFAVMALVLVVALCPAWRDRTAGR